MPRRGDGAVACGMARGELIHERLTHSVIGAFFEVYNILGVGFLEQIYLAALAVELRERGHVVEREVLVRVRYKEAEVGWQRLDMIVDGALVVEVKSTIELHSSARRQLQSYLCATRLELGLLLHFGETARFYRLVGGGDGASLNG
jgi:GxxExxY protein